jgi:hypothetical protein
LIKGLFTLFTFSDPSKVIVQSEQCKPAFSKLPAWPALNPWSRHLEVNSGWRWSHQRSRSEALNLARAPPHNATVAVMKQTATLHDEWGWN